MERIEPHMNIKDMIKRILTGACVLFTVITAIYALLMALFYQNEEQTLLDAERVFLFFIFSLLFSGANAIYRLRTLSSPIRLLIHFLICTPSFYICFVMPLGLPTNTEVVAVGIFIFFYFVVMGILALIRSRFRKNMEEATAYRRQYSQKGKK